MFVQSTWNVRNVCTINMECEECLYNQHGMCGMFVQSTWNVRNVCTINMECEEC